LLINRFNIFENDQATAFSFSIPNMDEKTIEHVKQTVEELLEKMGFPADVQITKTTEGDSESIVCNIQTGSDSNFLIGQHGVNLQALQHLARLIIRKSTPEKVHFMLDINSYREQKNQSVIELAKQTAEQALSQRKAVIMKPMSTYERRIVHMELSKNTDVKTESIGEGEDRKIVVKPAEII
jgi:spoIIIJ-associated protein